MGQTFSQDPQRGEQENGAAGAVVGAQSGRGVGGGDASAADDGFGAEADGHGIEVGHEQASRGGAGEARRRGEVDDEVSGFAAEGAALVGIVESELRAFEPGGFEVVEDELGDGRFAAAGPAEGHEFGEELLGEAAVFAVGARAFGGGHG